MKNFRKIAGCLISLAVMFILTGVCLAGYEFNDLKGNAFTAQWMAINQIGGTFGGAFNEAIQISTDMITDYDDYSAVSVLNGHSDEEIDDRELHVLYLVLAEGQGQFYIDMQVEEKSFDIATPLPYLSTRGATTYRNAFLVEGRPADKDATWQRFSLTLDRTNRDTYDTVVQEILFKQNPNSYAQSIPRPLVISNVANKELTAEEVPLIVRLILKDGAGKNANIVAYDAIEWDMTGDKDVTGSKLVFVPINDDSLLTDTRKINLYLTTEVVNHTSVRYAATTYDSYGDFLYPDHWKFDLARSQGTTYIDRDFQLARKAHIAPGLVTVFKRKYNVNEENKIPLRLYPVDDNAAIGTQTLRLNHNVIFGKILGTAVKDSSNLYEVTAFQLRTAGDSFYDELKRVTKTSGYINVPVISTFGPSSVTRDETMPETVLQHFTIDHVIPANLRTGNDEGLLPVHIRFNIPITKISDRTWLNELIEAHKSGLPLEDIFFEKYQISLLTETNSQANPWNLSQELLYKNQYNKQINVFYDPDKGSSSQDNDKGVITVSFIAMLMDGTRDGVRPELSIVEDHSITSDNDYIIIRDGNKDDHWKMTFLIAPTGYYDNPTSSSSGSGASSSSGGYASSTTVSDSGSSGGSCSLVRSEGLGIRSVLLLAVVYVLAFMKIKRGRS